MVCEMVRPGKHCSVCLLSPPVLRCSHSLLSKASVTYKLGSCMVVCTHTYTLTEKSMEERVRIKYSEIKLDLCFIATLLVKTCEIIYLIYGGLVLSVNGVALMCKRMIYCSTFGLCSIHIHLFAFTYSEVTVAVGSIGSRSRPGG